MIEISYRDTQNPAFFISRLQLTQHCSQLSLILLNSSQHHEMTDGEDSTRVKHPCVGKYRVEDTSAMDMWCGVYALRISTIMQLGLKLTRNDFINIYQSEEMQDYNRRHNFIGVTENFHEDQLAVVLSIWGRENDMNNLQLGVIVQDGACMLFGEDDKFRIVREEADMEEELNYETVWIHNDNARELSGTEFNHFSGVTIFDYDSETDEDPEVGDETNHRDDAVRGLDAEEMDCTKRWNSVDEENHMDQGSDTEG
ncbi:hypothetical protein J7T55_003367 [Diaporthe amygdali]|uniref:uncharacterized protein n=1 Tax=Phomopsis amygdali TaxID=1214568 RepID=UPI0022FF2530|nr:uncharacterized protein J7T55_003367 [Diaporthe amygdali]KAJ0116953.1 hypothetical protein J7T55_003367 [Diaporthe amygdali]